MEWSAMSARNRAILFARQVHLANSHDAALDMMAEARARRASTPSAPNRVQHRVRVCLPGQPWHDELPRTEPTIYNGSILLHDKWWSYVKASTYDALFIDRKGRDMRTLPGWGKRSLTSITSSLFRTQ